MADWDDYLEAPKASAGPTASAGDWDDYLKPPKERKRTEAFVSGAADVASGGFVDELTGLAAGVAEKLGLASTGEIPVATTREGRVLDPKAAEAAKPKTFGDTYKAARDSKREDDEALKRDEAGFYRAGQAAGVVGSMLVPVGGATSTLGKVGVAAGEGAVRGLGASEADLTEGDLAGAFRDAAIGGTIGAVAGGVSAAGSKVASKLGPKPAPSFQEQARAALAGSGYKALAKPAETVAKESTAKTIAKAGRDIAIGYGVDEALDMLGKGGLPVGLVLGALSAARKVKGAGGPDLAKKTLDAFKGKTFTKKAIKQLMETLPEASAKVFAQEVVGAVSQENTKTATDWDAYL